MSRRNAMHSCNSQQGLGLIELMIAMLIGLLVTAAAIAIFHSNKRAYAATQGIGRIQENSQAAFEMMARDIREAGGNPCDVGLAAASIIDGAGASTATGANWHIHWNRPLHGYEGSGLANQVANTDSIQMLRLGSDVRTLVSDATGTSLAYTPGEPRFADGDTVVVCDMRVFGLFRANGQSTVTGANGTVSFAQGSDRNSCGYFPQPNAAVCAGAATAYLFPKFATISRLEGIRWFVRDADGNAANGYSLYRQVGAGDPEEVVSGVQDMQIQYLGDAGYAAASSTWTDLDWSRVRAVRITLTMREAEASSAGSTTGAVLMRTFEHVVNLRNRTL